MYNQKNIELYRRQTSVPRYLFQSNLFPVSTLTVYSPGEQYIKTLCGDELLVNNAGLSQFDLVLSLAYKKIINTNDNFANVTFTLADIIQSFNRKEGGNT